MPAQSPHRPVLAVTAVVSALALVVTGWTLGRQGAAVPAARAASTSTEAPTGRARDGVLVSGTGSVSGRPDTLVAEFGSEARAASVDESLGRADRALRRIIDALRREAVDRADMQTADVEIYPTYDDNGNRVTGYEAQQRLTVTIRDVDRAGRLLGRAVDAGGDAARLSGLSFRIDDDSALMTEARRRAFDDARAKADLYADAAGRGLARVVSVSETVTGADSPSPMDSMRAAGSAAADIAVEPGRQQLSVTVTVEWAFA
jgi:uncharacterized protein YggE